MISGALDFLMICAGVLAIVMAADTVRRWKR